MKFEIENRNAIYCAWFLLVALALAALRLFLVEKAELFPDEALYHFLALNAPLNFCPHPPGIPALSRLGTLLLGKTELGARLLSFLLSMVILFPIYRLAYDAGGKVAARWSIIAYATTPIFVMFGIISTPDGAQLFCYALALLLTWKAMTTRRKSWWAAAGLVVGIALYVKYIIIVYFPALFVCLLLTQNGRRHLRHPGPYIASVVAFFVFMPFFLWREWMTDWSAIHYHLSNRQTFAMPSLKNITVYQLVHLGYYSPVLYILFLYAMVKMTISAVRNKNEKAAFLAAFSAVPWLLFAGIAAVTKRELSREQWDAPAYIPALIAGAVLLSQRIQAVQPNVRRWPWIWGPAIGAIFVVLVAIEGANGAISAAINRKPLFVNLSGWRAMALRADSYLAKLPGEKGKVLVTDTFAPALEYAFYSNNPVKAVSLLSRRNEKYGLEEVLAMSGADQGELLNHLTSNAIFVMEEDPVDPSLKERQNREKDLQRMYKSVFELPSLLVKESGRVIRVFRFYQCTDLQQAFTWGNFRLDRETN